MRFGVKLSPAASTRADFVLPVGSIEETITVVRHRAAARPRGRLDRQPVDRGEIERLPLNGRGLLTPDRIDPGTNVVPATRGDAGQFTATGQRPNTNYFTVDGVSANTGVMAGGPPAQSTGGALPALSAFGSMDSLISLEAVQEMRVTTSSSVAEFGRLPGRDRRLNSRSGSNEFHGAAAYRIRNELLNANDWFANQAGYGRLPLRLQDFTQAFGGPLRRNRTFFFLSYQRIADAPAVRVAAARAGGRIRADGRRIGRSRCYDLFPRRPRSHRSGSVGEALAQSIRPAGLNTGGARFDQALGSRVSFSAAITTRLRATSSAPWP